MVTAGSVAAMLDIRIDGDRLWLGPHVAVTFQRTLRIPAEGEYPLPPGLGPFPLRRVSDFADRVPEDWRRRGGVLLPIYQREAMWLSFQAPHWRPHALQVAVGKVNAVSGEPWSQELHGDPQSYVVVPSQPWLDGINAGDGFIRQFVAMPLGMGYTVEAEVTGREEFGGIQLLCTAPKPGRFPDKAPPPPPPTEAMLAAPPMAAPMAAAAPPGAAMGMGAGGRMRQSIYPDREGIDTWDPDNQGRVFVHLVDSMRWREITGEEPPPTPVTTETYRRHGLPWFDLYDEAKGDVAAPTVLQKVRSIFAIDKKHGFAPPPGEDGPIEIPEGQIVHLGPPPPDDRVDQGDW